MRPDTRSFSFTWMKGSQGQKRQKSPQEQLENQDGEKTKETSEGNWSGRRGSTGSRLRKLSTSLVQLRGGNRYSNINEMEDENNWQKMSEVPLSLEEEGEEGEDEGDMEIQMGNEPDVVTATKKTEIQPFQPVEGNANVGVPSEANGFSFSKRLNKTVQGVKASFGNFSQRFRKSTRRRYRMPSTPGSAKSPATRKILGRTPTKLYSPFGIESPANIKTPKRLADRPSTPRLTRKSMVSGLVYSPSNNFRRDLDEARRGMQDFHILSRDITRRSVRF